MVQRQKDCQDRIYDNVSQSIQNKYNLEKPLSREEVQKQGDLKVSFSPGLVILPNANVKPFPFEVKKLDRNFGKVVEVNLDLAIIKISVQNAPVLLLGDSSQVVAQDSILIIGYPITANIELKKLPNEELFVESSVQEGRIYNPNKILKSGYPVLVLDIQAAKGTEGSPLINDQGEVIGMLASSDSNSNVPLAIPTSTIWEFIRQSGTTNEPSVTDRYYRDGLKSFWEGNYRKARAQFSHVKGLFPYHSEAERLISQIDQIQAARYRYPWKNPTYQLVVLALVVGGIVLAYFSLRLLRRKLIILRQKLNSLGSRIFSQIQKLNEQAKLRLKITAKKIWLWSGISDKKGWYLLTAISLPLFLFWGAQYFTWKSANEQRKIADRRYRQELLEKYLDYVSQLIFENSKNGTSLIVIRAKTLSVLKELDGESKGQILGFLVDSEMIVGSKNPVDISRANFRDANLKEAKLKNVKLKNVNLTGADLTGADLTGADLTGADLKRADLKRAKLNLATLTNVDLTEANLTETDLNRANLKGADLTGANLTGTILSDDQLKQVKKHRLFW